MDYREENKGIHYYRLCRGVAKMEYPLNYCVESTAFISEAYGLLDDAKHNPENFKPYKWRALAYPYCLVLSKDDWKLTLCTRTVTRCTTNDITYEKIYALTDNQQVHELLGVYINCLRRREEESKRDNFDYRNACIEFTEQVDNLIDIYRNRRFPDKHCNVTTWLSDGQHTLTIWDDGRLSLWWIGKHNGKLDEGEIGMVFIDKRIQTAPLLTKYLNSLARHAHELS